MADLRSVVVGPPYAGLDTASGPGGGSNGTVPIHRNWLPHFPAKAKARGPIGASLKDETTFQKTWPVFIYGAIEHDDKLIVGYVQKAASNHNISPWQAPHIPSPAENRLFEPVTTQHIVNLKENTISEYSGGAAGCPYLQGERLGRNTFFLSGGFVGSNGILQRGRWIFNGGINYFDGTDITKLETLAPIGAKFIKGHLERLWVFGGSNPATTNSVTAAAAFSDPITHALKGLGMTDRAVWETLEIGSKITASTGSPSLVGMTVVRKGTPRYTGPNWIYPLEMSGTVSPAEEIKNFTNVKFENPGWSKGATQYPNALWYSAQEGPFGANAWTSPTSGLVNKIVVGNEENDYLVGGAVVNQNLVIFKRQSIWYLTGYSPETFVLRNLTAERGCVDPWSICEANGGVFFASQNGFEFFDGTEFHTIDSQVSNSARSRMLSMACKGDNGENVTQPSRVQISYFGNGYLFISMQEFALTVANPLKVVRGYNYLYHIQSGNWTEVSSVSLFEDTKIAFVSSSSGLPWLHDGKYFRSCPYLTNPDAEPNQVYWEIDPENSNAKTPIPSEFETDRIDLSGNGGYTSQLHRFMIDYKALMGPANNTPPEEATKPLKVTLFGEKTTEILNNEKVAYELLGQNELTEAGFTEGRRFEADTFTEAVAGVKMRVQTVGLPNEGTLTEIYDSIFELQTARQRRRV